MQLSHQQDRALCEITDWIATKAHQSFKPFFYLAGYAGVGKTWMAKHIAESVSGYVVFASFTGKAASVMRDKGCTDAGTIHSRIYMREEPDKELIGDIRDLLRDESDPTLRMALESDLARLLTPRFVLNIDSVIRKAALVIIDECSMVGERMAEDLMSFHVPILVLGDPAQLPPVKGNGYFTSGEPDFMLTEVHRQARESGILRLATDIRQGKPIDCSGMDDVIVVPRDDVDIKVVAAYDQVLVGMNRTRHTMNSCIRANLGNFGSDPVSGDRLVCLRNNRAMGLLNGEIYYAVSTQELHSDIIRMTIQKDQDEESLDVDAWKAPFLGKEISHLRDKRAAQEFGFGNALTCHKAQGSQWPRVVVFDESSVFRSDAQKWIYTACTRASKELMLVR